MTEKFCLRWNDFEANVSTAFQELREDKDFFDVTIACEDDQLQAHKVILSACSPFFRSVLKRNPHHHPLLYLKGVQYQELLAIINFMYHGEVNVAQEELNSFLAVAEELKVKGLTQNGSGETSGAGTPKPPRERPPPPRAPAPAPPPLKKSRPPPPPTLAPEEEEIQEVPLPVKAEACEPHYAEQEQDGAVVVAGGFGGEDYGDYGGYEVQGFEGQGVDPTMDNKGETSTISLLFLLI